MCLQPLDELAGLRDARGPRPRSAGRDPRSLWRPRRVSQRVTLDLRTTHYSLSRRGVKHRAGDDRRGQRVGLRPAVDRHGGGSLSGPPPAVPDNEPGGLNHMPEMLIGGEWRAAAAQQELDVVNPATEEDGGQRARRVGRRRGRSRWRPPSARSPTGRATDVEQRAAILAKAADLIARAREGPRGDADGRAGQAGGRGDRRGQPPRARRPLLRRGGDQGPRRPTRSCHRRWAPPTAW